jgi:hypothetical protein
MMMGLRRDPALIDGLIEAADYIKRQSSSSTKLFFIADQDASIQEERRITNQQWVS